MYTKYVSQNYSDIERIRKITDFTFSIFSLVCLDFQDQRRHITSENPISTSMFDIKELIDLRKGLKVQQIHRHD